VLTDHPGSSFRASITGAAHQAAAGARWYAVHTRSRHEKRVREQLASRPEVEVFLPLWQHRSRWKDRVKTIDVPLFPNYCFARFRYEERFQVLRVSGVLDLVGADGRPEPVPEVEIETIRSLVRSGLRYDPHPFLVEGAEVEVISGPFMGVRGRLVRKDRALRVVVSIRLIRQSVSVEIDSRYVAVA
jgi:transcription termination/antitermination protein NusG